MKTFIPLLFILTLYSNIGNSQPFNLPQLAIKDIERGFSDINYFRGVLLEKGFKYDSKENDETQNTEHWCLNRIIGNNDPRYPGPYAVMWVQMSTWLSNGKPWGKAIVITINKKLLSTDADTYADKFLKNVIINFPIKEVRPQYGDDRRTEISKYVINYLREDTKIKVEYEDDGKTFWFKFDLIINFPIL